MLTGSLWVLVKMCLLKKFSWDSASLVCAQQGEKVIAERSVWWSWAPEHLSALHVSTLAYVPLSGHIVQCHQHAHDAWLVLCPWMKTSPQTSLTDGAGIVLFFTCYPEQGGLVEIRKDLEILDYFIENLSEIS